MNQKSRYTIQSNLRFLSMDLWKRDRPFFFWGVLKGAAVVALPLLAILLQKSALDGILNHWQFSDFLRVVLLLTTASAAAGVLKHVSTVEMAHYQGLNRMRFLVEMEKVFLRCPYQEAENPRTQVELDRVSDLIGTSAPRTTEHPGVLPILS